MILTCPACAARFVVDPRAIGPSGRKVRCGKCKHEWMATAPLITMPAADIAPEPVAVKPIPPGSQLPVPVKTETEAPRSRTVLYAIAAAILIALPVVTLKLAPYFSAPAGKEAAVHGVAIEGAPVTKLRQQEGRPVLDIEGTLINRTTSRQRAPILKARGKNARGQVMREWTIPLTATQLEPGQRLPFTFSTPLADQGIEDVSFHLQ